MGVGAAIRHKRAVSRARKVVMAAVREGMKSAQTQEPPKVPENSSKRP